jgi:hypothetical protein
MPAYSQSTRHSADCGKVQKSATITSDSKSAAQTEDFAIHEGLLGLGPCCLAMASASFRLFGR